MKRIKEHITTIAVIVLLLLLAFTALWADKQELVRNGTSEPFHFQIENKVYYNKCDVCGEQAPTTLTVTINLSWQGWSKSISDTVKMNFMKPYGKVRYCVCFKCILKALKVPPDGGNHEE